MIPSIMIPFTTGNNLVDTWIGGYKIHFLYPWDWTDTQQPEEEEK